MDKKYHHIEKLYELIKVLNREWLIFPVFEIEEGGECSCRTTSCGSPGKHPRTEHGFKDASGEITQIQAWHAKWPGANWAVRTGDVSGVFVVDVDNNPEWMSLLNKEKTLSVKTPRGGKHYYFSLDGRNVATSQSLVAEGVDIRAKNAYAILAVVSAGYAVEVLVPPAHIPGWLAIRLNTPKESAAPTLRESLPKEIRVGTRNSSLVSYAGILRRNGLEKDEIQSALHAFSAERFEEPTPEDEITRVSDWIIQHNPASSLTDLGNADRLVDIFGNEIGYCYQLKKWLIWDGKRWRIDDDSEIERKAEQVVRLIYSEVSNESDSKKRDNLAQHARRSEHGSRLHAMIQLAQHKVSISFSKLDQNPHLLNVKNGTLNLETGELMEHDPALLITKLIDIEYIEDATCLRWDDFLNLILANDEENLRWLQKAVGYSLSGRSDERVLPFLYGDGANGKTTFLETLLQVFGEYGQKTSMDALLAANNTGHGATPYTARLRGARFVVASEMPAGRRLNEALIKDLTGGDKLIARALYREPTDFSPTHTLWLYGNNKPKVKDLSKGFWDRMAVIPFNVTIPEDMQRPRADVIQEFLEEGSGLLAWIVNGYKQWREEGLKKTDSISRATDVYKTESDVLELFLEDMCERHPDQIITKRALYGAYTRWCIENDERPQGKRWLTTRLLRLGIEGYGSNKSSLKGIGLKETSRAEEVSQFLESE